MNTRKIGGDGEQIAVDFLQKNGYEIIERNVRFGKMGEIDVIAKEISSDTVVFIEVKYNRAKKSPFGAPEFRCGGKKMAQIAKLANIYIYKKNLRATPVRIDAVAIDADGIRHYKNILCG